MPISALHAYEPTQPDDTVNYPDMLQPSHWKAPHNIEITYPLVLGTETDNTTIEADGTVVASGSATTYDDILPIALYQPTGAAAPNITIIGGVGTLKAQEFPKGALVEEFNPSWQISHRYKEQTTINPHLHLHIPANAAGGTLVFALTYTWDNVDGGITAESTIQVTKTIPALYPGSSNAIFSFGDIVGTGKAISSIFQARIIRPNLGTLSGSVWLKSADIHIEADMNGSREPFIK